MTPRALQDPGAGHTLHPSRTPGTMALRPLPSLGACICSLSCPRHSHLLDLITTILSTLAPLSPLQNHKKRKSSRDPVLCPPLTLTTSESYWFPCYPYVVPHRNMSSVRGEVCLQRQDWGRRGAAFKGPPKNSGARIKNI